MNSACESKLKTAYTYILNKSPFLASFFYLGGCIDDDPHAKYKTMFTQKINNEYYVFAFREFVENVDMKVLVTSIAHEALHAAFKHPERLVKWAKKRNADPDIFNYAADALINYILKQNKMVIPKGAVTIDYISRATGVEKDVLVKMSAEEIADLLLQNAIEIEVSACNIQGDGDSCSCSGGKSRRLKIPKRRDQDACDGACSRESCSRCGRVGHSSESCDVDSREELEGEIRSAGSETQRKVIDAYNRAKLAGKEPSWLSGLIDKILESEIDWRALIRTALRDALGRKIRYSMARPNRKLVGVVKSRQPPSRVRLGARRIVVSVDASGSMLGEDLELAIGDVMRIAREFSAELVLQFWDVGTRYTAKIKTPAEVLQHVNKLSAGGGTDPTDAFKEIASLKPDAVIVFSDLYWSNTERAARELELVSRRSLVVVASTTPLKHVERTVNTLSRFAAVVHARPKQHS